jgi:hypothetical protein
MPLNGEVLLVVHLAALLQRDGDSWQFVDAVPLRHPIRAAAGRTAHSPNAVGRSCGAGLHTLIGRVSIPAPTFW